MLFVTAEAGGRKNSAGCSQPPDRAPCQRKLRKWQKVGAQSQHLLRGAVPLAVSPQQPLRETRSSKQDTRRAAWERSLNLTEALRGSSAPARHGEAGATPRPAYLQRYDPEEPEAGVLHEVPAQHQDTASWKGVGRGSGVPSPARARHAPGLPAQPSGAVAARRPTPGNVSLQENGPRAQAPHAHRLHCEADPGLQRTGPFPVGCHERH